MAALVLDKGHAMTTNNLSKGLLKRLCTQTGMAYTKELSQVVSAYHQAKCAESEPSAEVAIDGSTNWLDHNNRKIVITSCEVCPYRGHKGAFGSIGYIPKCSKANKELPYTTGLSQSGKSVVATPTNVIPEWCPLERNE